VAAGPVEPEDVSAVWADLLTQPAARIRIRPDYLAAGAWDAAELPSSVMVAHEVKHVLDLEGGFDRIWRDRFKGATRTDVRKAERAGLVVDHDTSGRLAGVYYDLYLDWIRHRAQERRLPASLMSWRASRIEPLRKFQVVTGMLGDTCRIWVARLDGQPVAAVITLVYGTHAAYWRGFSNKHLAGSVAANSLLQRLAIEDACRAGCRYYNMGYSFGSPSLMAFKNRFGARPRQFPLYTFERIPLTQLEVRRQRLKRTVEHVLARRGGTITRTPASVSVLNRQGATRRDLRCQPG
jgi:hypothetical protein